MVVVMMVVVVIDGNDDGSSAIWYRKIKVKMIYHHTLCHVKKVLLFW